MRHREASHTFTLYQITKHVLIYFLYGITGVKQIVSETECLQPESNFWIIHHPKLHSEPDKVLCLGERMQCFAMKYCIANSRTTKGSLTNTHTHILSTLPILTQASILFVLCPMVTQAFFVTHDELQRNTPHLSSYIKLKMKIRKVPPMTSRSLTHRQ